jgi:hypothetical protein
MSLLDEVRTFEQTVVRRLRELEPLLSEYTQLRTLAQRLGISYSPDEQGTPAAAAPTGGASSAKKPSRSARSATKARSPRADKRATRRSTAGKSTDRAAARPIAASKAAPAAAKPAKTRAARSRGRKTSARPGQRSDELLRLVGEQPGLTVREVRERLGVDPTGLYRVANQLTASGRLRKDGRRLFPAEPAHGTPPAPAAPGGAPATDDTTATPDTASATQTPTPADANGSS